MEIGSLVASVTSAFLYRCGTQSMPMAKRCTIRPSSQPKTCFLLTHQLMCQSDIPPINAINPTDLSVTPTSWTPGRPRHSHHRSLANGKTTPICSVVSSRWICVHKHTTSFVRGCSAQSYVQTLNTIHCRGRTQHCLVGFSTPIAKRCRSQKATLSPPLIYLKSSDLMPCVIGPHQLDPESTQPSAKIK